MAAGKPNNLFASGRSEHTCLLFRLTQVFGHSELAKSEYATA